MPDPEYNIDELIGPNESEPPVIDVLVKSWIEELDKVYSKIQLTGMRYKLESAEGSDLDDIWGRIFQIKRYASESDDDYRSRLIVHTRILMGSGTIPNCEAIIDSLIGYPGGTNIESRWPGVNYISFRGINELRSASASKTKIEKILPLMLAAGMSYEMPLPISEYIISLILKCNPSTSYEMDAMLQGIKWFDYDISSKFARTVSIVYNLNAYLQKSRFSQYNLYRGLMKYIKSMRYSVGAYVLKDRSTEYNLGTIFLVVRHRPYNLSARMKSDMSQDYSLGAYVQRKTKKFYTLTALVEVA